MAKKLIIISMLIFSSFFQVFLVYAEENNYLDKSRSILDSLKTPAPDPLEIIPETPPLEVPLALEPKATVKKEKAYIENQVQEKVNKKIEEIQADKKKLYLELLSKSIKSVEEDNWEDAKANMDDVLTFFSKENLYYGEIVRPYSDFAQTIMNFVQGGLELDRNGDPEPDLFLARSIYKKVLVDLEALKTNFSQEGQEFEDMISKMRLYAEEEIQYINNLLSER